MAGRSASRSPELSAESAARLRADLVAFLARRTRDTALAEDLAQDAMLHLLAALPRFRGAATLRTWARRIAVNVWRDHQRRQAVRVAGHAAQGDTPAAASPEVPDRTTPADEAVDRHATHECLLGAVERLPVDARRVLLLHDFGDMPLTDVATALDCSPGAAKVRLHRARRQLAEYCRGECKSEVGADGAPLCTPRPTMTASVESPLPLRAPLRHRRLQR